MVSSEGMPGNRELSDLIEHLGRTTRLSPAEAGRVIAEILSYFSESAEEFIVRRHAELQGEAHKNTAIFEQIAAELQQRRFAAPVLTQRQIRRLVYG